MNLQFFSFQTLNVRMWPARFTKHPNTVESPPSDLHWKKLKTTKRWIIFKVRTWTCLSVPSSESYRVLQQVRHVSHSTSKTSWTQPQRSEVTPAAAPLPDQNQLCRIKPSPTCGPDLSATLCIVSYWSWTEPSGRDSHLLNVTRRRTTKKGGRHCQLLTVEIKQGI